MEEQFCQDYLKLFMTHYKFLFVEKSCSVSF